MMRRTLALALAGLLVAGDHALFASDQRLSHEDKNKDKAATRQPAPATPAPDVPEEPARAPLPNTLMDGTAIKLRIAETISSADAHVNQQVPFETTEDVSVQGVVIIPKGSQALATVTAAEPKKRMGRGGKLDVNIDSVRLADGTKAQLRAVKNTKGGGHVGAMTGAMVATGIVFFPAAPLFLFMHGKDITIPKGTEVTAFVQGDTRLDMARFTPNGPAGIGTSRGTSSSAAPGSISSELAKIAPEAVPGTAAAAPEQATLTIESAPAGADIEVDGKFMGNTPSTLTLAPGQHSIAVKKKGKKDWTRTMTVAGHTARINAELEAQ